jgi:hypothetical protein
MAAAGHRPHIEILGDDYPTPDGTCIRDYIHVTGLADAHVRALRYLLDGGPARAFNLGTGHTAREVTAAVERVTGRPVPVRLSPPRSGDSPTLAADPRLRRGIQPPASAWRSRFGPPGAGTSSSPKARGFDRRSVEGPFRPPPIRRWRDRHLPSPAEPDPAMVVRSPRPVTISRSLILVQRAA